MSHPCMCFIKLSPRTCFSYWQMTLMLKCAMTYDLLIFLWIFCWRWWNDVIGASVIYITIRLHVVAAACFSIIICHYMVCRGVNPPPPLLKNPAIIGYSPIFRILLTPAPTSRHLSLSLTNLQFLQNPVITIWWRLLRSAGFKYKVRLKQVVLNEVPFYKWQNCVILSESVGGKPDY